MKMLTTETECLSEECAIVKTKGGGREEVDDCVELLMRQGI